MPFAPTLVIDEQAATRRVVAKMLIDLGCEELQLADHVVPGGWDLVIVDPGSPDRWPAVAASLRALSPRVRIVLVSSMPPGALGGAVEQAYPHAVLRKPFTPAELETAVAQALAG